MENKKFAFTKENYFIMIAGLIVLAIGLLIMKSDSAEYGFGFKALTLAPIVILLGFAIQFVAIFYKKKDSEDNSEPKI
jgi:hypothetical protein